MAAAQHLGVSSAYKPDGAPQRGLSMIMSGDAAAVPYGAMVPQLASFPIGSSVIIYFRMS